MGGASYKTDVVNDTIRKALDRPGWTQVRLARALDVRPQTVNKWVSGENTPPHERWEAIEKALGLDLGTFYALVVGTDIVNYTGDPRTTGPAAVISAIRADPDLDDEARRQLEDSYAWWKKETAMKRRVQAADDDEARARASSSPVRELTTSPSTKRTRPKR